MFKNKNTFILTYLFLSELSNKSFLEDLFNVLRQNFGISDKTVSSKLLSKILKHSTSGKGGFCRNGKEMCFFHFYLLFTLGFSPFLASFWDSPQMENDFWHRTVKDQY